MWTTSWAGLELGVVPFAVGGPFAVLVTEELASCGAELVISVTSAGRVLPLARPPYFILIEKAWRDEGTSLHYQPPSEWSRLQPHLTTRLAAALAGLDETVFTGVSWTTDAPFRETASAIRRPGSRRACRGDGGGKPVRLRRSPPPGRGVCGPRHQHDGDPGRRLRQG
jgi:uridine phosphorylase